MNSERLSEVIIKDTNQPNGKVLVWQEVELGEKYGEKFEIEIFNYDPVMCSVDSQRYSRGIFCTIFTVLKNKNDRLQDRGCLHILP